MVGPDRIVAAYNELLTIRGDATYHDFLVLFIQRVFGEDWWQCELSKAPEEQHLVVKWHQNSELYLLARSTGEKKVHEAIMSAEGGHLLRLAFNLHQIRHLGILLPSLVKRLKNKLQFQGALYETAVAGAFARAGFSLTLEPEGKGPEKRCEFVAKHRSSAKRYSVEAKSRHRPGVLGRPEGDTKRAEPYVQTLVRKALLKTADHDRIVCVDINYPAFEMNAHVQWGKTIREQVDQMSIDDLPPAILVFTNSPFHYLDPDAPVRGDIVMTMGLREPRFEPQDRHKVDGEFPGLIAAMNHFTTPVPGDWS